MQPIEHQHLNIKGTITPKCPHVTEQSRLQLKKVDWLMLKMAQQLLHKVLVSFLPLFSPRKEGIFLGTLGGGVPPISPNPDPLFHQEFAYYYSFLIDLELKLQIRSQSVHSLSSLKNHSKFQTKMCNSYAFCNSNLDRGPQVYQFL